MMQIGKSEVVWGPVPLEEFLHVDDLADAVVFLMNHYDGSEVVNIGTGRYQHQGG
jgi:GDP-L-fucose synthase